MPSLIGHLLPWQRRQLLADLNYLNLAELRSFCRRHAIPWKIWVATSDGRVQTRDSDRKSVVLGRVRHYLRTGRVLPPTCFAARIVRPARTTQRLGASDRLYYGTYDKKSRAMIGLLQRLTGGRFRSGAVARILAREYWTAGVAPTFAAFARAWSKASVRGLGIAHGDHPEAAWLTDRARNEAGTQWKSKRKRIARRALQVLGTLRP